VFEPKNGNMCIYSDSLLLSKQSLPT